MLAYLAGYLGRLAGLSVAILVVALQLAWHLLPVGVIVGLLHWALA